MESEICASGTQTHKLVKARKEYKCCECCRLIHIGSQYWYFKACWPTISGWDNFKTCQRCEQIRNLAMDKYPKNWQEDNPPFGELFSWIREQKGY